MVSFYRIAERLSDLQVMGHMIYCETDVLNSESVIEHSGKPG